MFPKPTRIRSKASLEAARSQPCVVCGKNGVDAHHIKTRGSGGHDTHENLLSLCRLDHQRVHLYGVSKMAEMYPRFREYLVTKGWEFSEARGKWIT